MKPIERERCRKHKKGRNDDVYEKIGREKFQQQLGEQLVMIFIKYSKKLKSKNFIWIINCLQLLVVDDGSDR